MGKKQRQKQQRVAGRKPHRASGKVDVYMTCMRGEEWCVEVGEGGHMSPDYYHSPPQEEEVEPEPQPQEEDGWEAFLHSMGVQYCCCICGEWGHFPANCPLPPEECLLHSASTTATSRGREPAGPASASRGSMPAGPPAAARREGAPAAFAAGRGGAPAAFAAGRGGAGASSASNTTIGRSGAPAAAFMARGSPPAITIAWGCQFAIAWAGLLLCFAWGCLCLPCFS
ncbi:UNVERIFIED_CONTAM: hypothetical protein FKN15_045701 [Acipenser sinensis]